MKSLFIICLHAVSAAAGVDEANLTLVYENADGKWTLVSTQDSQTKVGIRHPVIWSQPSLTTQRLRFRCSSPRGVIVGDPQTASLNAFFED